MRLMLRFTKARSLEAVAFAGCLAACCPAWPVTTQPPTMVANSSVRVWMRAGEHAPRIESIGGARGNIWPNDGEETLPSSAEVDGASVSLAWQLKPELNSVDGNKRKVVFVYESAEPRLRLSWIWEARADFGPVEHRILVENLSGREVWLPMVDSLRLDLRASGAGELRNFY